MKYNYKVNKKGLIEIHGPIFDESGWFVVCLKNGDFDVYEFPNPYIAPRFYKSYKNLYDALESAEKYLT